MFDFVGIARTQSTWLRGLLTVALWTVCSAGSCTIHASSGHCRHYSNDPNHRCGHTHFNAQSSSLELDVYRAEARRTREGRVFLRYEGLDALPSAAGEEAAFARTLLERNRDELRLGARGLTLEQVSGHSSGLTVRFATERSRARASLSGNRPVLVTFDARGFVQRIDVH